MKLVYCPNCEDIFRLMQWPRQCICGNVRGWHVDQDNVKVQGDFISIGIHTDVFEDALKKPKDQRKDLDAWIFPEEWERIHKIPKKPGYDGPE